MNLDNFSYQELLKLKDEVESKLDVNSDFWSVVSKIKNLSSKKDEIDNDISTYQNGQLEIKSLIDLGYTLVIYDFNKVGIINYEKKRVEGKYHGCSFTKLVNKLDFTNYIKPSQEDVEKIKRILLIR